MAATTPDPSPDTPSERMAPASRRARSASAPYVQTPLPRTIAAFSGRTVACCAIPSRGTSTARILTHVSGTIPRMREHRYTMDMPHSPERLWALFQDYDRWTAYAPMVLEVQ